jgi:hypothetical protein
MTRRDVALAHFAETRHGVFTAAEAATAGFDPHERAYRIRSGHWLPVHSGVYRMPGSPFPHKGSLLAACHAGGIGARTSHRSAAWLWELPGGSNDLVEITCLRRRRAQRAGLVVHETELLRSDDRTAVDGVPVTTVARTLLDLGAVCTPSVVEMALERALRRELVTLADVDAVVQALGRRGRNGVGVLRQLVVERDPRSAPAESEMETRLRRVLVRHGFPAPTPQFVIRDGARFVARVDFAYPELRIAIEYDSLDHHMGRTAHIRDNARRNEIVGLDWTLIVATVEDVRTGGHALARAIRSRFGVKDVRQNTQI